MHTFQSKPRAELPESRLKFFVIIKNFCKKICLCKLSVYCDNSEEKLDETAWTGKFVRVKNENSCKWNGVDVGAGGDATFVSPAAMNSQLKFRKIVTQNGSSLPQIAIKRKNNDSPSSMNTEVVLLNGNWDTSNKIPNIIAEMHNVNIEELQALQNSWGSKLIEPSAKFDLGHCITPSPRGSDSGIEGDCADGNLSWLLNYKIHELPPVPDCASSEQHVLPNGTLQTSVAAIGKINQVYIAENISKQYFEQHNVQNVNITRIISDKQPNSMSKEEGMKLHGHTHRYSGPKKPPFTYTELIEHALNEKGELTVSGIYQWISDHFPFYKQNDDRWKNSVRHNLSINPHFRKGNKAVHGAGHLWTIAQREDKKTWNIKKQRIQQFIQTSFSDYNKDRQLEMELETATASILPDSNEGDLNDFNRNGLASMNHESSEKQQNIEIEYVNVIDVTNGLEDFLCPPVPKEQMVEECGLGGSYSLTELNPAALGLNISDAEIITGGNLYDDLNFQCYELQND